MLSMQIKNKVIEKAEKEILVCTCTYVFVRVCCFCREKLFFSSQSQHCSRKRHAPGLRCRDEAEHFWKCSSTFQALSNVYCITTTVVCRDDRNLRWRLKLSESKPIYRCFNKFHAGFNYLSFFHVLKTQVLTKNPLMLKLLVNHSHGRGRCRSSLS